MCPFVNQELEISDDFLLKTTPFWTNKGGVTDKTCHSFGQNGGFPAGFDSILRTHG